MEPQGLQRLYTSPSAECVRAEFQHIIDLQPTRPALSATEYTLDVRLGTVLDLTARPRLEQLGLDVDNLADDSILGFPPYQRIGGAVKLLGYEGLLVPSVRITGGVNLVIYSDNVQPVSTSEVSVVAEKLFVPLASPST